MLSICIGWQFQTTSITLKIFLHPKHMLWILSAHFLFQSSNITETFVCEICLWNIYIDVDVHNILIINHTNAQFLKVLVLLNFIQN